MGIGTSLGAYYEDDFDHQAGLEYTPPEIKPKATGDNNVVTPEGQQQKKQLEGVEMKELGGLPIKYDTPLAQEDIGPYADWKAKNAPNDSGEDYDLQGAFKAGISPDPSSGHWPDTFKKPNHPTFSNESQYAKDAPELAGHWEGDKFIPPQKIEDLKPLIPDGGEFSKGNRGINMIFGVGDEKRFQLWPERMVRDALNAVHNVASGKTSMWAQDPNTGELHTSIEGIEAAHTLMPFIMSGTIPGRISLKHTVEETPVVRDEPSITQQAIASVRRQRSNIEESTVSRYAEQDARMGLSGRRALEETPGTPEFNRRYGFEDDGLGANPELFSPSERAQMEGIWEQTPFEGPPAFDITARVTQEEALASAQNFSRSLGESWERVEPRIQERYIEAARQDLQRQRDLGINRSDPWDDFHTTIEAPPQHSVAVRQAMEGDKLKLIRDKDAWNGTKQHQFKFANKDGVGELTITEKKGGRELYVNWIGTAGGRDAPGTFGTKAIKEFFREVAREFPNAEAVTGFRVSGARHKTSKGAANAIMEIPGRRKAKQEKRAKQSEDDIFIQQLEEDMSGMLTRGQ